MSSNGGNSRYFGTPVPLGNIEYGSLVPSSHPSTFSPSPIPLGNIEGSIAPTGTPTPMNARRAKFNPVLGAWGVGDSTPQPYADWYRPATFPQSSGFKFPSPNSLDWSMLADLFQPKHR